MPSIPIDKFKDHYVVVFDLTSMQDAAENSPYPELVGQLRLKLNFTFPLEQSLYWVNDCLWLQFTSLVLLETISKKKFSLQQITNRIPLLQNRYLGSFPSDYVPTLDNDFFATINTQPSDMQGEHCILIAKFRQQKYFAVSST